MARTDDGKTTPAPIRTPQRRGKSGLTRDQKTPIGLWVFDHEGNPELLATLSVRANRARERAKHLEQRKYGRRPFLARIAGDQPGERIPTAEFDTARALGRIRLVGHAGNVETVAGAWKASEHDSPAAQIARRLRHAHTED